MIVIARGAKCAAAIQLDCFVLPQRALPAMTEFKDTPWVSSEVDSTSRPPLPSVAHIWLQQTAFTKQNESAHANNARVTGGGRGPPMCPHQQGQENRLALNKFRKQRNISRNRVNSLLAAGLTSSKVCALLLFCPQGDSWKVTSVSFKLMNTPITIRFMRGLMLLTANCVTLLAAAPAGTGTIEGRVLNSTNGTYLNNARVTVEGTTTEAFTNEIGEYRLANVPAGAVTVRASFTGLTPQKVPVSVVAGQRATQDFSLARTGGPTPAQGDTVVLDAF